MRIGGHITSTLEFPGHMSIVIFSAGCNLRCPYCHNPELIAMDSGEEILLDEIFTQVEESSDFIDAVVISGGEPLLQDKNLKKILNHCQELDLKTKLDTNGSYPKKLKKIIDQLNYVALDVKAPFDKYKEIIGANIGGSVRESMEIVYNSDSFLECRTTYVPSLMNGDDIKMIAQEISCDIYTLQQFRNRMVLDEKLYETRNATRDELYNITNQIKQMKPSLGNIKIKTGEFGDEVVK